MNGKRAQGWSIVDKIFHNSCSQKMSRHRCNKNDDLVFACPSNCRGLRPRLAALPRPRLQSKDKHMKKLRQWIILAILDEKIQPEVTTSLNKDITFCLKQSYKKHLKINLKGTQKWPQNDSKWILFGVWEPPWNHGAPQSAYFCANLVPEGAQKRPFGTPWGPWGPTNQQNLHKNTLKVSIQKHNTKKSRTRTLPNLKKYSFTIVKHTFLEIPLTSKKSPKWLPNDPKWPPKTTQWPSKGPPRPPKRRTEN